MRPFGICKPGDHMFGERRDDDVSYSVTQRPTRTDFDRIVDLFWWACIVSGRNVTRDDIELALRRRTL